MANVSSSIQVGSITNSYGVAIGAGARSEVNIYEGPSFPRPNYRSTIADLLTYYTGIFVGREQETQQFLDFTNLTTANYLLVSAGAGSGKSALMASLIKRWEAKAQLFLTTDLIYYFVRQQGRRHTPLAFLQNLNGQLLDLLGLPGGVPPDLTSLQSQFSQLWSAAVTRAATAARSLLLLVDGLDEMALGEPAIADLLPTFLTPQVHIIVTSRPNPEPREAVDISHPLRQAQVLNLGHLHQEDITALLAEHGADSAAMALAPAVWALTKGEPLLARFVCQEVAEHGVDALARLQAAALGGVESYFKLQLIQLDDVAEDRDLTWQILGLFIVALGGLTLDELSEVLHESRRKVRKAVEPIQRFLIGDERFVLMHQQFHDVLMNEFSSKEQSAHHAQLLAYCARWHEHGSEYALQYYAQHLADAATSSQQPQQHEYTRQVVDLVLDDDFQKMRLDTFNNLAALQQDWLLAIQTASINWPDNPTAALLPLIQVALGLVNFTENRVRADPLFALAEAGQLAVAEQHLGLYPIEPRWQQAAALALAWVATDDQLAAARTLVEQTRAAAQETLIHRFAARVLTTLDQQPFLSEADLPAAPSEEIVQRILTRFGGAPLSNGVEPLTLDHEGYLHLWQPGGNIAMGPIEEYLASGPIVSGSSDMGPVLIASIDGLHLTAYAVAEPERGQAYFEQYINLHAANSYAYYRNASLWFLLDAVLRHPDDRWAKPLVQQIIMAVLVGREPVFQEAMPFVVKSLMAHIPDPAATQWLTARRDRALAEVALLVPERGQSDVWGNHKRTLAALAEAYTVNESSTTAAGLVDDALHIPRGYAGYQTTASLALAESIRIVKPWATAQIAEALVQARRSAHNIQEAVFCARSNARVNAMCERWWNSAVPFDVIEIVRRLAQEPEHPLFTAHHIIGDRYVERHNGPDDLPLPDEYYSANTLAQVVQLYQQPFSEFERLNRAAGWTATDPLPQGAVVNVPDPDFAPFLAARIAAEVLVAPGLAQQIRVQLIQQLVPIAARNPTTLDTVIARMLLAARPTDLMLFDSLGHLILQDIRWLAIDEKNSS